MAEEDEANQAGAEVYVQCGCPRTNETRSRIVDRFGGLGTSGEYGSIEIDPNDFVIEDDKRDNFDSRISEI